MHNLNAVTEQMKNVIYNPKYQTVPQSAKINMVTQHSPSLTDGAIKTTKSHISW